MFLLLSNILQLNIMLSVPPTPLMDRAQTTALHSTLLYLTCALQRGALHTAPMRVISSNAWLLLHWSHSTWENSHGRGVKLILAGKGLWFLSFGFNITGPHSVLDKKKSSMWLFILKKYIWFMLQIPTSLISHMI